MILLFFSWFRSFTMEQLTQLNRVEVRGIIGNVRLTKISDTICAKVTVATNYAYKAKDSSCIIETTWHSANLFPGKNIREEDLEKIQKGDKVHIIGRLRAQRYTGVDGTERTVYEISASSLEILGVNEVMQLETA